MRRTSMTARSAALVGLAVAALIGCGDGDDSSTTTTTTAPVEASGAEVTVAGFAFDPEELEVQVGDEVTWTNDDGADHTATAEDGAFDVALGADGGSGSTTFDEPGTYAYVCSIHSSMTGAVVVDG